MRRQALILATVVLALLYSAVPSFSVVYVKSDSPGPVIDGSSWSKAFRTIQAGIDAAYAKEGGDEVWVAKYHDPAKAYYERIRLKKNVFLYGGFVGTETSREQRDWKANETIIDGQRGGSVVTSHLVSAAAIEGFTIRNPGGGGESAGIYCDSTTTLSIGNNVVTNCRGGLPAIRCDATSSPHVWANTIRDNDYGIICSGSPNVSQNAITRNESWAIQYTGLGNAVFFHNTVEDNGGGLHITSPGTSRVLNNYVRRNRGIGIYCHGEGTALITENEIIGNNSSGDGGGMWCGGSQTVAANRISGNRALRGGGIFCYNWWDKVPTIVGNTVVGNNADYGGGVFCEGWQGTAALLVGNIVTDNTAAVYGGGIYAINDPSIIIDNLLLRNQADAGGGLYVRECSPFICGNTVAANRAKSLGGGIYCYYNSSPTITNTIFYGNTSVWGNQIGKDEDCNPTISNCFFWEKGNRPFDPISWNPIGSNNNIEQDPLFLAPWAGDYHLRFNSPCIGAGDNSVIQAGWTDLDGKARILPTGGTVDIGCFEYDETPYWLRTLAPVRAIPHMLPVELKDFPVTAALDGEFYIESPDRTAGVRVASDQSVKVGDLASVIGLVTSVNGEVSIEAASVATKEGSEDNVPAALVVPNRSLGGGAFFHNHRGDVGGQEGISGGSGLNNIGLLVRTTGKVRSVDTSGFNIDDGSGVNVRVSVPEGVEVPTPNSYVTVTGISSCYKDETGLHRLLKLRRQSDIVGDKSGTGVSGKVYIGGLVSVTANMESPHPYANNCNDTWTINAPEGTMRMRVHFAQIGVESGYDFLHIKDGSDTVRQTFGKGSPFVDVWSNWISGGTVKLNLVSDNSITDYGFRVDKYEFELTPIPIAGVTVTLDPLGLSVVTGADGAYSFEDLAAGTYTITPSLGASTFNPPSRSVTLENNQRLVGLDFLTTAVVD